jgi:hypothetical protein
VQQDAAFWEDVIDENGLDIGNDSRPTHHWTREDQQDESVIDLTVGVDRQEEADHERVVGWNLAAMTEKDVEAAGKLWAELSKERAQLDAECTVDEVEQEAAWCQETMSSVLDTTAKKIRICARSKRWWNADIKEKRRTVGRERRRRRHSEEAARAKAEIQKSIRRSK